MRTRLLLDRGDIFAPYELFLINFWVRHSTPIIYKPTAFLVFQGVGDSVLSGASVAHARRYDLIH
jgi:hypothetical protein